MTIVLRALGASEIRVGRRVLTPAAEVVFGLGLYLCVRAGERLTRQEVSELFWGDGREAHGRHSLRQMLYRLRQKGLALDEDGSELYLDPARVDSDLARALEEGWPAAATAAEVDAAAVLAPGFRGQVSAAYQAWLEGVRAQLAAQHRRACLRQLGQARREGRWADLDRWALQVLRSDPLNEEATLARAESAAISGSKAVALEIIDAYMAELGDRAPVIGLPASVLRRRIAERRSEWSGRGPREVPLVGRAELMSRLTGYVDAAARGEGNSVLLWGAPGIGKTRLAEEVCAYAGVEGFRVVGRQATNGGRRPLGLVLSLISELLELRGALGCSPGALRVLRQVTSGSAGTVRPDALVPRTSLDSMLTESFNDLVDAVTQECRVLIVSDDLHNADNESIALLTNALRPPCTRRLLWIATTRSRPTPVADDRVALFVPPLDLPSATRLTESLLGVVHSRDTETSATVIAHAAGGNPLFLRELSLQHHVARGTLPLTLREVISERLATLAPSLLRLLRVASTLSSLSTVGRLRTILRAGEELSEYLDALERQGIIRSTTGHSVELHECWLQVIGDETGPATKLALKHECAIALAEETPHTVSLRWRAAVLFEESGDNHRAFTLFCECGEEMLARGLPQDAVQIIDRAVSLAETDEEKQRALVLRGLAEQSNGQFASLVTTCEEALALRCGDSADDLDRHATLVLLQTDALAKVRLSFPDSLNQAIRLISDERVSPAIRQALCLRATGLLYLDKNSELATEVLDHSHRLTETHGESVEGWLTDLIHAAERGDTERVVQANRALDSMVHRPRSSELQCRSHRLRFMALRYVGLWSDARRVGEETYQLSRRFLAFEEELSVCEGMLHAELDQDQLQAASLWLARLQSASGSTTSTFRTQSMTHSRARFLAQSGDYSEALRLLDGTEDYRTSDAMRRRRSVDVAMLAFLAAATGDRSRSMAALDYSLGSLKSDRASLQADFIMEMSLRALAQLGEMERLENEGKDYALKRSTEFRVPIAPYFQSVDRFARRLSE